MLATLSGDICLLFGLALLLLPLLAVELSRPRDGVWGAVVLILGLVLVTSSDRMRGAPMLAVLCGSLLAVYNNKFFLIKENKCSEEQKECCNIHLQHFKLGHFVRPTLCRATLRSADTSSCNFLSFRRFV